MEKIKIQDIKTKAVKEVNKSLASDYIGTGNFKLYTEPKETFKQEPKNQFFSKNKNKED